MGVVVYGKHPGYGDFLAHGLEAGSLTRLEAWVQGVLPTLRADLGEGWARTWDAAPMLRFWIGGDVLGTPFWGLWAPACDKVGRRYPLMIGHSDPAPPPTAGADAEADYAALEAHLTQLEPKTVGQGGAKALISGIAPPKCHETLDQTPASGMLWGQRADGDLTRLLADAAAVDAAHAQCGRSHWWYAAGPGWGAAGWLAVNGLPDAAALRWLMADAPAEVRVPPTEDDATGEGERQ